MAFPSAKAFCDLDHSLNLAVHEIEPHHQLDPACPICPPTRALSSARALPMREPSGHFGNGDQALDDDDAFSDTDSEKSLLSDSDAPERARRHPRERPQPPLPHAEHEPRPVTSTEESDGRAEAQMPASNDDAVQVAWRHLPRKDQLIVITLARLSEPLVQTSLQVIIPSNPPPIAGLTLDSRTCFTCSSGSIPSFPTRSSPARPVSCSALSVSLPRRSP